MSDKVKTFVESHKGELVIGCLCATCGLGAYLFGLRKGSLSKYEEKVVDTAKVMLHETGKCKYVYTRAGLEGKVSDLGDFGKTMLDFIPDEFTSDSDVAGIMVLLK